MEMRTTFGAGLAGGWATAWNAARPIRSGVSRTTRGRMENSRLTRWRRREGNIALFSLSHGDSTWAISVWGRGATDDCDRLSAYEKEGSSSETSCCRGYGGTYSACGTNPGSEYGCDANLSAGCLPCYYRHAACGSHRLLWIQTG